MEAVNEKLVEIAIVVIIGVLSILAQQAKLYLKKLSEKIKNETTNEIIKSAFDRIENVAEKVVLGIEQTVAKELRESIANGTKPKEAWDDITREARETVIQICSNEVGQLEEQLTDVETYIKSLIEAKVYEMKQKAAMYAPLPF